jgi:poly(A) polymerase
LKIRSAKSKASKYAEQVDVGALQVIEQLRAAGFQALLAGGCVRDLLLGRMPKDWDIATDADPREVTGLFDRTVSVGARFGIVVVLLGDRQYEVARFRRDGPYRDGRRPESVEFADAEADARRRDFTVNGMFYDPLSGDLLDYVQGQRDLEARVIRAIGDPTERFSEDYLRLLRAVRFAARLDFTIESSTFAALCAHAEHVNAVSAERIRDELTLLLTEGGVVRGLQLLDESGLLEQVLPEVAAMRGVEQPPQFHPEGDVWTHVKLLFEHLGNVDADLAWGALLHDIGKPPTFMVTDRIRFNCHDAVGAKMATSICQRLRMSNQASERICELVAYHMRIRDVKEMRASKLKRLLRQPYFSELLRLHRADCLASHGKLDLYEFCQQQLVDSGEETLRPAPLLRGADLIAEGYAPGPRFKAMLAAVEDAQLEGQLSDRGAALLFLRENFSPALA